MQEIKNAAVPYNTVGLAEVRWTPLAGPEESDVGKPLRDVEDADQLLGKSNAVSSSIKCSPAVQVTHGHIAWRSSAARICRSSVKWLMSPMNSLERRSPQVIQLHSVSFCTTDSSTQRPCSKPPIRPCSTTARSTISRASPRNSSLS